MRANLSRRSDSSLRFATTRPGRGLTRLAVRATPGPGVATNAAVAGSPAPRTPWPTASTTWSTRPTVDQRDHAAAEATAGHARAQRTRRLGRLGGHVEFGHGDLEVVSQRGVRRASAGARSRPGRPARSSTTVLCTRSFSVTTCRTRRRDTSSASASSAAGRSTTSRSARTPRAAGRRLAGRAPVRAYSPSTSRCGARVSMITMASPAAARSNGTCCDRETSTVQEQRVAGAARTWPPSGP